MEKLRPKAGGASRVSFQSPARPSPSPKYSPARKWAARDSATPSDLRACRKVAREEPDAQRRELSSRAELATRAAAGAGERGPPRRGRAGGGAAGRAPLPTRLARRGAGSARCAAGTPANHRAPPPVTGRLAWPPQTAPWCRGAGGRREGGSEPPTAKVSEPSRPRPGPPRRGPAPAPPPPRRATPTRRSIAEGGPLPLCQQVVGPLGKTRATFHPPLWPQGPQLQIHNRRYCNIN